jgi:hypothetical protein
MNAILIQLKKPNDATSPAHENWLKAINEFSGISPSKENVLLNPLGCLLSLDGDASPDLAKAITVAVKWKIPYKITFFEKATEWNYSPPAMV